jgi:hypothetical protein
MSDKIKPHHLGTQSASLCAPVFDPPGGNGNPVTWSISGDTTDFALSGSTVVVGP